MSEPIHYDGKIKLLIRIRAERHLLEDTLARLTPEQMLQPATCGAWSVKDTLAHISAWERWMVLWTGMLLRGELPDPPLPWDVDRMNAEVYAQVKDKPLAWLLDEFHKSYRDSLALVEGLSEEQLQVEYTDTWPMGRLWTGVAANLNWHYKEHRELIEAWLENNSLLM